MTYNTVIERGGGGFGIVHEVTDQSGQTFAKKTLRIPHNVDPNQVIPRFEREVKYQSAINHPNVVEIIEHNLQDDPPWFIMPLAECSLKDRLTIDRQLGGNHKKPLFDILAGLEEIHRRGFLHRDLKPANVLVFTNGDGTERYAVSDFGLMAVGETESATLTPSGLGGGTPLYQAPECALNLKRATAQSDFYSFGAMLFDIFAPSPIRLPHDELSCAGKIGDVIARCTKRNPHRRYNDVAELRDDLFDALNDFVYQIEDREFEDIISPLLEDDYPSDDQWDDIFELLDTNDTRSRQWITAFRGLQREHIAILAERDAGLFSALGSMFSKHITDCGFNFDYCDVLASKAQMFFDLGSLGLKAQVALGLLELGTSHNRWAVERRFLRMVGPDAPDELAERILVECDVQHIDFARKYRELVSSIGASADSLHPTLRTVVAPE